MTDLANAVVTYTQPDDAPATEWVIDHGLNTDRPVVNVWIKVDGVDTAFLPQEIRVMTVNSIKISFSHAMSGVAVVA